MFLLSLLKLTKAFLNIQESFNNTKAALDNILKKTKQSSEFSKKKEISKQSSDAINITNFSFLENTNNSLENTNNSLENTNNSLENIKELKLSDLYTSNDSPFLIFLFYEKDKFNCPLCQEFKNHLKEINFPIKTLNFVENVEMASRFLQHTFPAFVIRHKNQSYIIDPVSVDDLIKILKSESWKLIKPVRPLLDATSFFAIAFSKINRLLFLGVLAFHKAESIMPDYVVTLFIISVIIYLIYSIVTVIMTEDPKIKKE